MTDTLVRVVGWTLIHSVWQGAIVVAATATLLALIPRASARLRYAVLCGAMLMHLTAPIVTAVVITQRGPARTDAGGLTLPTGAATLIPPSTSTVTESSAATTQAQPSTSTRLTASWKTFGASVERLLPLLAMLWLVGVGVSALRRVGGWLMLRRLIARATPAAAPVAERVASLARTMGIPRMVQVLVSTEVTGPFTSGWLRPVIVLPLSMLSGLDPIHVNAIVAHELAHIRRWDFVVAVLQSIVLTVLFHHPATWWLDRRLRIEREYCCDDLAVLASRDRVGYVRALAELESQRLGLPSLALAATDGSLQHRVARLLGARSQTAAAGWVPVAALLAVAIAAGALDAASVPNARPVAPDESSTSTPAQQQGGVIRPPDPSAPLESRFAWALDQAKRRDSADEVIIGWRIRSAVSDGREIISSTDGTSRRPGPTVSQLLNLSRSDAQGVAILLTWSGGTGGELTGVRIRDLNSSVVLRNDPFIWLDRADDSSSVALIQRLMAPAGNSSIRSELGAVLTLHDDRTLVVQAATRILDTERDEHVRAETMAWLGSHTSDPRVLALLRRAVDDSTSEVRDEALTALGDGKGGQAVLLELLRTSKRADVRGEAVQKLSGGGDDVVGLLLRIAFDDAEADVQAEAVDAIKERSGSASTRALRDIAQRHPDRRLRSEARDALDERGFR